ncbi:MAG: histidine phosphatase family protein [Alphaproteobacteria bacterium]|nr:MAG: histidine phosphatase family protein [Alphaproteobacteria bacterium]
MIRLLLIRHGKTDWNAMKKLQGRRDIPLSDTGRRALASFHIPAEYDGFKLYASPLSRAEETAKLLSGREIFTDPALIEMDWGDWEGEVVAELRATLGADFIENEARGRHMQPPGGESPAMVMDRLRPWLRDLRTDSIAVTHKGVIRALAALAFNWDMTGKPPVSFNWTAGHLFEVSEAGDVRPLQMNISLERE